MTLDLIERGEITPRSKPDAIFDYACELENKLSTFTAHMTDNAVALLQRQFRLSRRPAELLALMVDGRLHSKIGLIEMLYPRDQPEVKIIDVFICKLRDRLKGSGIEITTVWGHGYQIMDTTNLKRALAGEDVFGDVPDARAGKPAGGFAMIGHGAVLQMARTALRARSVDGVVEITSGELSAACEHRAAGSDLINRLSKKGELEVLRRTVAGRGGVWKLRLVG